MQHKSKCRKNSAIIAAADAPINDFIEKSKLSYCESESDDSTELDISVCSSHPGIRSTLYHSAQQLKNEMQRTMENYRMKRLPAKEDLQLTSCMKSVPPALFNFLSVLTGKSNEPPDCEATNLCIDSNANRKILSICQDICSLYSNGKYVTPKSYALGIATRHITGSSHMSRLLAGLGHSISYDSAVCAETAMALNQLDTAEVLPAGFKKKTLTMLVFDNIDFSEETLSGAGSTHHTNGIIIQLEADQTPPIPQTYSNPRRQKSFQPIDVEIAPCFLSCKQGPQSTLGSMMMSPSECKLIAKKSFSQDRAYVTMKAVIPADTTSPLPGWTAFNISLSSAFQKSKIHYLPVIESSPTELATVKYLLNSAIEWSEKLQLPSIIVVFDQAIYSKAQQLRWSDPVMERRLVLRLGEFHTCMSFLSILGKRYKNSGFEDVLIEAEIIAEGSMNGVLSGHMYNRSIRAHKLMFEAMARLQLLEYLDNCDGTEGELFIKTAKELHEEYKKSQTFDQARCSQLDDMFQGFKEDRCKESPTYNFWNSYIEMVMTLLAFIRGTRLSDWNLHLASLRLMLPWYFAYDRTHYSRFVDVVTLILASLNRLHYSTRA